jgi:HD-GYP domain-containing protein (c-di-GMP phosphodiesterase class II)
MAKDSGSKFDPELLEIFVQILKIASPKSSASDNEKVEAKATA